MRTRTSSRTLENFIEVARLTAGDMAPERRNPYEKPQKSLSSRARAT